MSYHSAIESLFALGPELATAGQKSPRKFDLENMRRLTEALGHPERRVPTVLVAGTNGKGSTSATLASILRVADYETGLYTSPHLIRPNERIRLNDEVISDAEFAEMHARVEAAANVLVRSGETASHPSFFEMITAMAFEYFASVGVDIAVLEVGMGGRLDATNIAEPLLSVISDVALDHMEWLGDSIGKIAYEKAGIIHQNGVLVTLPQHPEANEVIGRVAMERNARGVSAAQYVPSMLPGAEKLGGSLARTHYPLTVMGEEITVDSPLVGRHQIRNIALAIAAAEELNKSFGFEITARDIERGIRETNWQGRFQVIPGGSGGADVIVDVAHNPAGAWALRSTISEYCDGRPLTLVFGAMRDKAIEEMAQILFPIADQVIATKVENPRAAAPEEIAEMAQGMGSEVFVEPNLGRALTLAKSRTPANGVIVITGSVYLVGAALEMLTGI
jgi:dihydrofolate synthase / folylpolyglutamate synthase